MKKFFKKKLYLSLIGLTSIFCSLSHATGSKKERKQFYNEHTSNKTKCFKHNIQLQLSDSFGFPVPGTEFWVELTVKKESNKVTLQFPTINFQTGPISPNDPFAPPPLPGGYIYTSTGFLPKDVRPKDLVYRSLEGAANSVSPFSLTDPIATLPFPPSGFIVSITNAGAIVIQCAGTFGNIIPPGPQTLMAPNITYLIEPQVCFCDNIIIDAEFTNTTQFTGAPANIGIRDSHVCDAFDGKVAFSYASNSTVRDKTNGTTNCFVAVGTIQHDGTLLMNAPVQLTDLPAGSLIFDTAVGINRTNKDNILVTYEVINTTTGVGVMYHAVSFDGGTSWPINAPTNIQPTGTPASAGNYRGAAADKFGNFWISATNLNDAFGNNINQPFFAVSSDQGQTFQLVFTLPAPAPNVIYDYPQICFGGDGQGNYGLIFTVSLVSFVTGDFTPIVGFIPITGLGSYGTPTFVTLPGLLNTNLLSNITASVDGRLWMQGFPNIASFASYIQPIGVLFKSPGTLDVNYAGLWQQMILNCLAVLNNLPLQVSQPVTGYISNSVQSIIYDESRQTLFALVAANIPDYSQNMNIYLIISRDNGQTWTAPIEINTTDFANRGFQSMALDSITRTLVFGWYDGRNDSTFQSLQYFGASLSAKTLDELVSKIPLSNPLYAIPSAAFTKPQSELPAEIKKKVCEMVQRRMEMKYKLKKQ